MERRGVRRAHLLLEKGDLRRAVLVRALGHLEVLELAARGALDLRLEALTAEHEAATRVVAAQLEHALEPLGTLEDEAVLQQGQGLRIRGHAERRMRRLELLRLRLCRALQLAQQPHRVTHAPQPEHLTHLA